MAQLLEVPRSLLYRKPVPKKEFADVLASIEKIVLTFLGYGYRRVLRTLRRSLKVTEYRTRKLLRENGLNARRPRSRGVTRARLRDRRAANLLKGQRPTASNQIWVGDTTLVRTSSGPVYVAILLDAYSRKAISWHMSRRNDEALVRSCLEKALQARRPDAGWVHHTDQGSTYTAQSYVRRIREAGGRLSYSAPGRPQDNGMAESFMRTLKLEEVDRNRYETYLEAEASLERYMNTIYNQSRMHSALGYQSPDEFEAKESS